MCGGTTHQTFLRTSSGFWISKTRTYAKSTTKDLKRDKIYSLKHEEAKKLKEQIEKLQSLLNDLTHAEYYPAKDPRCKLPIPKGATNMNYKHLRQIWPAFKFPPLIDRFQTLLALLQNAYETHYGTKPVVTMCTTGPGFGKTRTLIEWGVQVFQHPCVVAAFLNGKKLVDPKENEDIETQILNAWKTGTRHNEAIFLVQLHRTMRESTVVSTTSAAILEDFPNLTDKISAPQVVTACRKIIIRTIKDRWPSIDTENRVFNTLGVEDLINKYLATVATTEPDYAVNDPIVSDPKILAQVARYPRTLIINIDEVQELLNIKGTRNKQQVKNMAYEIARQFVNLKDNRVVNMVGLQTGPIEEIEDQHSTAFCLRPSLPLDPLLARDYLSSVCNAICGRHLYEEGKVSTLPKKLSHQLHQIWVSACGIPRTIELMATKLAKEHILMLQTVNHESDRVLSNEQVTDIYKSMQQSKRTLKGLQETLQFDDMQFHKLLIQLVFCTQRDFTDMLGKHTFEYYEGLGHIIPFQFASDAGRRYTIPFFLFGEEIYKEVPGLASDFSSINNGHNIKHTPCEIRLDYAIKALGRATTTADAEVHKVADSAVAVGQILEKATAISTWLRYLLAVDMERNKVVALSTVLPELRLDAYIRLKGVVQLKDRVGYEREQQPKKGEPLPPPKIVKSATFDHGVEFIMKNGLIAINKASSSFADILIPLCDAEGNPTQLLCIQCRNVQVGGTKVRTHYFLVEEASRILQESPTFVYVVVSPNISDEQMSERSRGGAAVVDMYSKWEKEKRFIISNGNHWLSDWFLRTFRETLEN